MPMFDFECPSCGHERKDKIIKFGEVDTYELKCSECGVVMKRLLGLSRFKMGKSCFVKINPTIAEQVSSEAIMQDYKDRISGKLS